MKKMLAVAVAACAVVLSGAGLAAADTGIEGAAANVVEAGVGNLLQPPVHVPVNAVGNTATVIGGLNPTFANDGFNG
ncbi:chaplin [Streptomyces populi]|uniref:chaplin n=1 Tax=Streptomyces populi TaxID=2058924 RepID=UPI0035D80B08